VTAVLRVLAAPVGPAVRSWGTGSDGRLYSGPMAKKLILLALLGALVAFGVKKAKG
jgi:hypothetical protein